ADDQVPVGRGLQLCLQLIRTRRHVEPEDQSMSLDEGVSGNRRLDLIAREDVEAKAELLCKLVLPLLDETARRNDEAALKVAADQKLLDEERGHDRLAGPRIVGEEEAQGLPRQHLAVDGGDLMRQ